MLSWCPSARDGRIKERMFFFFPCPELEILEVTGFYQAVAVVLHNRYHS